MMKSAPTLNVKIVAEAGAWILQKFHKHGTVVKVDAHLAKNVLATHKDYKIVTDEAKEDSTVKIVETDEDREAREKLERQSLDSDSSELHSLKCPEAVTLHKAGLTTVEALKKFVADNGDAWFKKVNGIGPAGAKDIADFLAKQK